MHMYGKISRPTDSESHQEITAHNAMKDSPNQIASNFFFNSPKRLVEKEERVGWAACCAGGVLITGQEPEMLGHPEESIVGRHLAAAAALALQSRCPARPRVRQQRRRRDRTCAPGRAGAPGTPGHTSPSCKDPSCQYPCTAWGLNPHLQQSF